MSLSKIGQSKCPQRCNASFRPQSTDHPHFISPSNPHRRQKAAANRAANPASSANDESLIDDGSSPHLPTGPKKDFSLKEGETFAIKLPGGGRKITSSATSSTPAFGGGFGGGPLLPPPPSKKR